MKNRFMKMLLCLTLSVTMIAGEAAAVGAAEVTGEIRTELEAESSETEEVEETGTEVTGTEVTGTEVTDVLPTEEISTEEQETETKLTEDAELTTETEQAKPAAVTAESEAEAAGVAAVETEDSVESTGTTMSVDSISAYYTANEGINLYWNVDIDEYISASSYDIYRATSANGKYSKIATIQGGSYSSYGSYTYKVTTAGSYYFKVTANITYGDDNQKISATSAVKGIVLYVPTGYISSPFIDLNQHVRFSGYTSYDGMYESNVSYGSLFTNVSGYEVYRSTKKNSGYKKIGTMGSDYIDKTLTSGKTYYYKIRPFYYNAETGKTVYGGYSEPEGFKNVIDSADNLVATVKSKSSAKLTWNKVKQADGYEIYYRADIIGDGYKLAATTNKTNYTKKGLTADTGYYFLVRSYKNEKGVKTYYSSNASVYVNTGFTSPSNVKITKQTKTYSKGVFTQKSTIVWDKVIGAAGYRIIVRDSATDQYKTIATLKSSKTSYVLSQSISETNRSYYSLIYIEAYKGSQKARSSISSYSEQGAIKDGEYQYTHYSISPNLDDAVLTVKRKSNTSAALSWKKVTGATNYTIYRGIGNSYYYVNEVTGTSYIDTEVAPGTEYEYYIYATNTSGIGINSSQSDHVKYTHAVAVPSVKAANKTSKAATLTITDATKTAKKFVIYRSTSKKGTYKKVATVTAGKTGVTTYTQKKLAKKKTYYYKVAAVLTNANGVTVESNQSSAKAVKITK